MCDQSDISLWYNFQGKYKIKDWHVTLSRSVFQVHLTSSLYIDSTFTGKKFFYLLINKDMIHSNFSFVLVVFQSFFFLNVLETELVNYNGSTQTCFGDKNVENWNETSLFHLRKEQIQNIFS